MTYSSKKYGLAIPNDVGNYNVVYKVKLYGDHDGDRDLMKDRVIQSFKDYIFNNKIPADRRTVKDNFTGFLDSMYDSIMHEKYGKRQNMTFDMLNDISYEEISSYVDEALVGMPTYEGPAIIVSF